jgi:O-antigen ligase/tetratricopeptide (TPR) repeat protein
MARRKSRPAPRADPALRSEIENSRLRRFGVAVLCAKVALVPLIFDYSLDWPFTVAKALTSHALAYVLAAILAGLLVRFGREFLPWSWLHVPVLAFLVFNVAATLVAADRLLALFGAHPRMLGLGTVADWVLVYFAIAMLLRTRTDAIAVAASALGASVIVLGYELVQLVGADPFDWNVDVRVRPFSTIGQPTSLAHYLTILAVGAAGIGALVTVLPRFVRALMLLIAVALLAGASATATRSIIVGLVAGSGVLVFMTWLLHPSKRVRWLSLAGAVVASASLAAIVLFSPLGARLAATIEPRGDGSDDNLISRLEPSSDTRIALYEIGVQMVSERPILGYGPDNFAAGVPKYRSENEPWEVRQGLATSAHSWVAYVSTSSGVLGLAAFVGIAVTAFVLVLRGGFRPMAIVGLAMLSTFLGTGLTTINDLGADWLFWAAAGMVAAVTAAPAGVRTTSVGQARRLVPLLFAAIGLLVSVTGITAWDASHSIRAAELSRLLGRVAEAIRLAERATQLDPTRAAYWQGLGLAYVAASRWADASSAFDRAVKLAPYDARPIGDEARAQLLLANGGDAGARTKALALADEGVRIDPNNPQTHLTRAVVMQFTANMPEAVRSIERALRLDPESTNQRLYVSAAQIYIDSARPADAVRIGREGTKWLGQEPVSVPVRYELARALVAVGMPREAIAELDVALAIQPANASIQRLRAEISASLPK